MNPANFILNEPRKWQNVNCVKSAGGVSSDGKFENSMVSIYQQASTHLTASEDRLMDIMEEGIKWRIQKEPQTTRNAALVVQFH